VLQDVHNQVAKKMEQKQGRFNKREINTTFDINPHVQRDTMSRPLYRLQLPIPASLEKEFADNDAKNQHCDQVCNGRL